jgi:hypothetical protein
MKWKTKEIDMEVFTRSGNLAIEECCNCGVAFAMPASLQQRLRDRGGDFFCPNGHSQHYCEPTVEALKKKLVAKQAEMDQLSAKAAEEKRRADAISVSLNNEVVAHSKTKKRIAGGACPCCNRWFKNVCGHMKSKHPDFSKKT